MLAIPTSRADRKLLATVATIIGLAMIFAVSRARLADARASHTAAVLRVEEMANTAERIRVLRSAPRIAIDRARPNDELLSQVRSASLAAAISPEQWRRNDPRAPVRIPKTPYQRVATLVSFDRLTMRQFITFLEKLVENDSTLAAEKIRLTRPSQTTSDTWNVEVTLGYLIYSPTSQ